MISFQIPQGKTLCFKPSKPHAIAANSLNGRNIVSMSEEKKARHVKKVDTSREIEK
jgi:hypothetical protein